jgi:hypothetical protein
MGCASRRDLFGGWFFGEGIGYRAVYALAAELWHRTGVQNNLSECYVEKDSRILIGLLQFQRELCDMELGSLALRQRRCAYTERKRKFFLIQSDAIWNGGQ